MDSAIQRLNNRGQTNYPPETSYPFQTNNSSRYKSGVLINIGPKFVFAWFVCQTSEVDNPSVNLYLDGKRRVRRRIKSHYGSCPYLFPRLKTKLAAVWTVIQQMCDYWTSGKVIELLCFHWSKDLVKILLRWNAVNRLLNWNTAIFLYLSCWSKELWRQPFCLYFMPSLFG